MHRFLILLALLFSIPGTAAAQEVFFGAYAHGARTPLSMDTGERGVAVAAGYRLPPAKSLKAIGSPQPYVVAAVHTSGETSYVAAGLSWKLGKGPVFVRPAIGVAVHDGPSLRVDPVRQMRTELGSRVLFQPEIALGVQVSPKVAVEASWMHISHAQLASRQQNPGLDQIGVRLSIRLGRK